MNMETIIRVPLNEQQYQSLLYYVNQNSSEEYVVKRLDALNNFDAFLDENEKKVIEGETWINYIVFYKLI